MQSSIHTFRSFIVRATVHSQLSHTSTQSTAPHRQVQGEADWAAQRAQPTNRHCTPSDAHYTEQQQRGGQSEVAHFLPVFSAR